MKKIIQFYIDLKRIKIIENFHGFKKKGEKKIKVDKRWFAIISIIRRSEMRMYSFKSNAPGIQ